MSKEKHTTLRLTTKGRDRLARLAPDYPSQTAVIEAALEAFEGSKIAFGQQVQQATARLIEAARAGDEAAVGATQMALAELFHSLPAATGVAGAIREIFAEGVPLWWAARDDASSE